jgi:hypothetical protein
MATSGMTFSSVTRTLCTSGGNAVAVDGDPVHCRAPGCARSPGMERAMDAVVNSTIPRTPVLEGVEP